VRSIISLENDSRRAVVVSRHYDGEKRFRTESFFMCKSRKKKEFLGKTGAHMEE